MKIYGTAKGGALSKKDFGVAFGSGETPCTDDTFTIADSNRTGGRTIGNSGGTWRKFAGLKHVFTAGTLTEAKVFLDNDNDVGTSGNVQLAVYAADGSDKRVLDSLAISSLSDTMAQKTFSGSVTVNENDMIGVTIDEAPSSAYRYNVGIWQNSSQIDDVESWEINNSDAVGTLMSGSDYLYLCGIELSYCE